MASGNKDDAGGDGKSDDGVDDDDDEDGTCNVMTRRSMIAM